MDKPTIFFSHSSIDREYISELKGMITGRTSGTVNVFQSSDGESIPFGNNWVHKIEENLHKAKIMFVFVSPKSISSSWIYFESGFAYSKGVRVIPVGIKGVDVGALKPPLNLLQGFNVSSSEGMNNIISVLNKEFACSFDASFSNVDFERVSQFDDGIVGKNNEALELVDYVHFNLSALVGSVTTQDENNIFEDAIERLEGKLQRLNVQTAHSYEGDLHAHGLYAVLHGHSPGARKSLSIKIDPYMLIVYEPLISELFLNMYENNEPVKGWFKVYFKSAVELETEGFKVSSRLSKVDVGFSSRGGDGYNYMELDFALDRASSNLGKKAGLRVIYNQGDFRLNTFLELLTTLRKVGVIR
ncbi:toll/interleukin-1 receptor domain-containing protein [Serratia marcescens]|uniref:toll/interleukin-1 receptor domain-containing protein n=1 Tax=Serratia marcescens TaxID=615 RepID=UPI000CCBF13E|nr:toll/interleukin-1 receptor domain-containing protein [Serratia marcescens]PNU40432.1 hypothetical protein C2M04_09635 [Serratia marcescens]